MLVSISTLLLFGAEASVAVSITNSVSEYNAAHWQQEEGLPNNLVHAIAQTRDGYLWVATQDGLVRFDGVRFARGEWPGVTNAGAFTALYECRDGSFWAGTGTGQVVRRSNGKFSPVALPQEFSGDAITALCEGRDGAMWIGSASKGLVTLQQNKAVHFTQAKHLQHNSIRAICEDKSGVIWIGTHGGLASFKNGQFTTLTIKDGLLHNSIRALNVDDEGDLWIGCAFGLSRMHDGQFIHYTRKDGLAGDVVTSILQDSSSQRWIGTFNGLNRLAGQELVVERPGPDRVHCLFQDGQGNIWVGTRDGLSRLKPRVLRSFTREDGLTYNHATSVLEDRDGNLWVGFWGGGADRIAEVSGKRQITSFTSRDVLCSDLILTMHQSRSGRLWFGADYDGGLSLMLTNGTFVDYRERLRDRSLTPEAVKTMLDDAEENLWIGTRSGLMWHKGRNFRRYTTEHGLPSDNIEAICEDHAGRVWIGTTGGLALLTNNPPFPASAGFTAFTIKDGLAHNSVTAIYEDTQHVLWLGTRGGLCRIKNEKPAGQGGKLQVTPHISSFTTKAGLHRDEIFSVIEDDFGFLWMSCRDGIFRVRKKDLEDFSPGKTAKLSCQSFDKSDGMVSAECKGTGRTAALKSKDGRLWFPTSKGIIAVDPRKVALPTESLPVFVEGVRIDGAGIDLSKPIRVTAGKQKFSFSFTALDFSAPEKVRFKYQLEGLDDGWIDADTRREVHYGHIPAGEYRFRVTAAGSNGVWNENGSSLFLTIQPPFWQTNWFLALACLSFAGVAAGTVRYVAVKHLQRRLRETEQQHALEKERTRIAQDMHDELGSRLTEILMLSEGFKVGSSFSTKEDRTKIAGAARAMSENLDAIVWAVEPRNDSLQRVAAYLYDHAVQFLGASSIRCRLDVPHDLPDRVVTSETRHHLFMVVKEALNNIAKYAEATEVWFRLRLEHSSLIVVIEDNGKGFLQAGASSSGNGLINMQKRMSAIGGYFNLRTALEQGTRIEIKVPLNR